MPAKKTVSVNVPAKRTTVPRKNSGGTSDNRSGTGGSGFFLLLIVFMVGLSVVPAYYILQYEVKTLPDGIIMLSPRKSGDDKKEKSTYLKTASDHIQTEITAAGGNQSSDTGDVLAADCARNRWLIREAARNYFKKHGQSIAAPTIFELIGQKYLKELPNCPSGGSYELLKTSAGDIIVRCSLHGKSNG